MDRALSDAAVRNGAGDPAGVDGLLATFAAFGVEALALKGAGKLVTALITQLVAVALLWLCVGLPKSLARMAR